VCISKREGECKQICNQEGAVRIGLARCTVGSHHHRLDLESCVSVNAKLSVVISVVISVAKTEVVVKMTTFDHHFDHV
jgi:hypothetical protein